MDKKMNGEIYRVELVGKLTAGKYPENLTEEERERIGEPIKFTAVLTESECFDYGNKTSLVLYEESSHGTSKHLYDTRYEKTINKKDPETLKKFLEEFLPKTFRVEF